MTLPDLVFTDAQRKWKEIANEIGRKYLLPQAAQHDRHSTYNEEAFQAAVMVGVTVRTGRQNPPSGRARE